MEFSNPVQYNRRSAIFLILCILISSGVTDTLAGEVLTKPTECLVCGQMHTAGDFQVSYKGMEIPLCSEGCQTHYEEARANGALDPITAKLEPRSALFQADSNSNPALRQHFLFIAYYVVIGLIFGGGAAYVAVQKGADAWSWFLAGLCLNVLGFLLIMMKPAAKVQFSSKGLSKVPVTQDESRCPSCGHSNHPSAKKCSECAVALTPTTVSEVESSGIRKEHA